MPPESFFARIAIRRVSVGFTAVFCLAVYLSASAPAQQYAGARQVFDGRMLPGLEVSTFEHSETLFPVNTVARGGSVRPLPQASAPLPEIRFTSHGTACDLYDYLTHAYDTVTVRDMLLMASAVKWDETYTDPKSDRRKVLDLQLTGKPGSIIGYMKALPRAGEHGTIWNYSTGDSFLVGAVIEGAVHKPLAQYLSETLWSKLGMEQDATWWLESPGGMGLGGSGLGATLHDYARFAQFVLDDGVLDGKRIVPEGWFREAGSPHRIGGKMQDYGYLWWPIPAGDPIHQGAFQAIGIFGQHIYINPREKLAIVVLSARSKPASDSGPINDVPFFAAVARALH